MTKELRRKLCDKWIQIRHYFLFVVIIIYLALSHPQQTQELLTILIP